MGRRRKIVRLKVDRKRVDEDGNPYTILLWRNRQGEERRQVLGFSSSAEAEAALGAKLEEISRANRLEAMAPTVGAVTKDYLEHLRRRANERYARTEGYLSAACVHLASRPVDTISTIDLEELAHSWHAQGRAKATVRGYVAGLSRVLRHACRRGWLKAMPPRPSLSGIPNDGRPARRLTQGEVARLITAAADDAAEWGDLVQTLAWSGRRPIAVLSLHAEHCQRLIEVRPREEQLVFFPADKGGRARGFGPVTEPARRALRARVSAVVSGPLWRTPSGRPFTKVQTIWRRWRRWVAAAGLIDDLDRQRTPQIYDLRRFAVTRIIASVEDLRTAMQFTGHEDVNTLLRYSYSPPGEAARVAVTIDWAPESLNLVVDG